MRKILPVMALAGFKYSRPDSAAQCVGDSAGARKRKQMQRIWWSVVAIVIALNATHGVRLAAQLQDAPIRHDLGQSITPAFEGWFRNPDGTISLSFGYMNRNYKEELTIPVGPNNKIEPGSIDQGQPTHFLPRRHTGVFTVVLPKDAPPTTRVMWTLTAHGQTHAIPGHLKPEWEIDALKDQGTGNKPPTVKFQPEGAEGLGQRGIRTAMTATVGQPLELAVWVGDDEVGPKRRSGPNFGITWSKFRGGGRATFSEVSPKVENGKATTTVTFGAPGDFVLRVLAWDNTGPQGAVMAGGFYCCWTNAYVDVTVAGPRTQSP